MCAGTLEDYVEGLYQGASIGATRDILLQMTEGLCFLHSKEIIHGDIEPTNILISKPSGMTDKPQMKLGDFCLRSTLLLEQEPKDVFMPMERKPNSIYSDDGVNFEGDIFLLGRVFLYTLSGGVHPFDETTLEQSSRYPIKNANNHSEKTSFEGTCRDYDDLIYIMCNIDPEQRPTAQEVLQFILTIKTTQNFGTQKHYDSQERKMSEDEGIEILSDDTSHTTNTSTDSVQVEFERIHLSKLDNKSMERKNKKIKIVSNLPSRKAPRFSKNECFIF